MKRSARGRLGSRPRAALLAQVLGVLLVGSVGCRGALSSPSVGSDPTRPAQALLLERLNPFLLAEAPGRRVSVEVDWVEGSAPHDDALAALDEFLRKHLPSTNVVEVQRDDEIPRAEWSAAPGRFSEKTELLGSYLDHSPRDWPAGEVVYVVYAPGEPGMLGWTTTLTLPWRDVPSSVVTVFLFPDAIRREAMLWVRARSIERAILVHEAGHVLGLVADPRHEAREDPRHCTEPDCVMASQGLKSQLYNALPVLFAGKVRYRLGPRCRQDLEWARTHWGVTATSDPALVEGWVRERRRREIRAQACWYARNRRWSEALAVLGELQQGVAPAAVDGETLGLEQICDPPQGDSPRGS